MTASEKKAVNARAKDLMAQGIEKTLARVMAEAELSAGIIRPVVNF